MSDRGRRWVFVLGAAGLGLLMLRGMAGLPAFGAPADSVGERLNAVTVAERHLTNVVTAVNFDYRGFDTLGEEFILFAAVAGVALLLRARRGEPDGPSREVAIATRQRSEAVRWLGIGLIGVTDLFGLYIVVHAHQTPGGGFQGGAILGTGSLLAYLATDYRTYRRATPKHLIDLAEAVGAGAYALIGLGTMLVGGAFLENVLPLGRTGDLISSGTILPINLAVGLEVAAGFALLYVEFLEEVRSPGREGGRR